MGKVIPITNGSAFDDLLQRIQKENLAGRVRSCIIIASVEYPKGEKPDGFSSQLHWNWFNPNGSCAESLGLCDIMKSKIHGYMDEMNEE